MDSGTILNASCSQSCFGKTVICGRFVIIGSSYYFHCQTNCMKDIFDPAEAAALKQRIENLLPDTKPVWGKMNVAQMLSHLQAAIEVALGEKKLKKSLMGMLLGSFARKVLLNEKPFGKSLPTDPSYIRAGQHDFDTEQQKLLALITKLVVAGKDGLIKEAHPFFGKMMPDQWSWSLYKHVDHHLRQFGA